MKEKDIRIKFKELINDSKLNFDQKKLWELFILKADQNEVEAVFEAAQEESENLFLLTDHLRDKIFEMEETDEEGWDEVMDEEENYSKTIN